ncbi:hypothetical protein KIN20_007209 [Parelaphostrongylus tenuis]|uniref:C2H2-type domain-containing protein n=1 Tax=Parelaphostrongylus tenuis TaxID=148309 RepID=A0AAD5M646_PARTN|nr:hypothetical protein KIN20_007209 [Parelaphostrongylus tenuis]
MVDLSSFCANSASPTFDLATFLSGALQLKSDGQLINELAFSSKTIVKPSAISTSASSSPNEGRKRRRGEVANPANTLDGLVARRADDTLESFQKRCLSEEEAIEGPDDEQEARRMERDPDVSTRMCSACGYVGKWISEMIRHKRVHTNERPFKCRYCSRTSKWKADLIRHVAKTHGIRVLSKYSRSKAFDHSITKLTSRGDDDKPKMLSCESDKEQERQKQLLSLTIDAGDTGVNRPEPLLHEKVPLSYRCSLCHFEQIGHSMLVHHLRAVHNKDPYECRCRAAFVSIGSALSHATTSHCCSPDDLVLNVIPAYGNRNNVLSTISSESLSPTTPRSNCSPDSGVQFDLDEVEPDRISMVRRSTSVGESDNETTNIGKSTTVRIDRTFRQKNTSTVSEPSQMLPSIPATTPTTTPVIPPVDISTALMALQLPFVPDYLLAMASFRTKLLKMLSEWIVTEYNKFYED